MTLLEQVKAAEVKAKTCVKCAALLKEDQRVLLAVGGFIPTNPRHTGVTLASTFVVFCQTCSEVVLDACLELGFELPHEHPLKKHLREAREEQARGHSSENHSR